MSHLEIAAVNIAERLDELTPGHRWSIALGECWGIDAIGFFIRGSGYGSIFIDTKWVVPSKNWEDVVERVMEWFAIQTEVLT